MNKYSYLFKYIIIGDATVGKSCLLLQFLDSKFRTDSEPTVGVEFGSKTINIQNNKIKLQVWDTAGQQIFKSITRSYYRGSIGAILVYDITNKNSFKNVEKWLDETKSFANQKLSVILVGNKSDLENQQTLFYPRRQITYDQECSAKSYELTEPIFFKLAEEIINKINQKIVDPRNQSLGIKIGTFKGEEDQGGRRGYCC